MSKSIEVSVRPIINANEVRIDFGEPIDWAEVPSKVAREIAIELWVAAAEADGVEPTPLPLPARLAGQDPTLDEPVKPRSS